MKFSEIWHGKQAEPATRVAAFHDTTLEALRVATQVQQAGSVYEWTMRIATVYRGAQILSDLAAQLPWFSVDGGRHSGQQLQSGPPEKSDPQPAILLRPDPFISRGEWLREVILSLVFDGNAYLFKSGLLDGVPISAQVLVPGAMSVGWNPAQTRRTYSYRGKSVPAESIDHLALNRMPGQPKGVGPIGAIAQTLAGQIAADKFARDLFTDGGIPTGMLEYPGKLNETEAKELLRVWNAAQDEARKTAVLSGGTTYSAISLSPDQAQMLQSRSFGVSEIARALGIPAHLLNAATGVAGASGASMTYTNTQDVFRELLKTTLFPVYLERISEVASAWLPRGKSVHFDDRELLRADTPSRYNAHKVALDAGFLTVDEVRESEGLPPSPELEAEKAEKRAIAEKISGGGDTSEGSSADDDDRAKSDAE